MYIIQRHGHEINQSQLICRLTIKINELLACFMAAHNEKALLHRAHQWHLLKKVFL